MRRGSFFDNSKRCVVCEMPLTGGRHECPKPVLAAMEAAERRADMEDDPEAPSPRHRSGDERRAYGERLSLGFAMMRGEWCS